jgi:hypothetical protein
MKGASDFRHLRESQLRSFLRWAYLLVLFISTIAVVLGVMLQRDVALFNLLHNEAQRNLLQKALSLVTGASLVLFLAAFCLVWQNRNWTLEVATKIINAVSCRVNIVCRTAANLLVVSTALLITVKLFVNINVFPLWEDEAANYNLMGLGPIVSLGILSSPMHPYIPLHYGFMAVFSGLFGSACDNAVCFMRLSYVLPTVLLIWSLTLFSTYQKRMLPKLAMIFSIAILLRDPAYVQHSVEAQPYGFFFVLAIVAVLVVYSGMTFFGPILASVGGMVHPFGVILVAPLFGAAIASYLRPFLSQAPATKQTSIAKILFLFILAYHGIFILIKFVLFSAHGFSLNAAAGSFPGGVGMVLGAVNWTAFGCATLFTAFWFVGATLYHSRTAYYEFSKPFIISCYILGLGGFCLLLYIANPSIRATEQYLSWVNPSLWLIAVLSFANFAAIVQKDVLRVANRAVPVRSALIVVTTVMSALFWDAKRSIEAVMFGPPYMVGLVETAEYLETVLQPGDGIIPETPWRMQVNDRFSRNISCERPGIVSLYLHEDFRKYIVCPTTSELWPQVPEEKLGILKTLYVVSLADERPHTRIVAGISGFRLMDMKDFKKIRLYRFLSD